MKALIDAQLAALLAGRGMGLALAAELNGYPGPMHALKLADALGIDAQHGKLLRRQVQAINDQAIAAGERVIAAERALDHTFADRRIDAQALATLNVEAGTAQAEPRATHLKYHFDTAAPMTPEQHDLCVPKITSGRIGDAGRRESEPK